MLFNKLGPREETMDDRNENRTPAAATVLVTGATGYIGGRLVPRLLEAGYAVRCLVRDPRKLAHRPWTGQSMVSVITGDRMMSRGFAWVAMLTPPSHRSYWQR